MNKEQGTRNIEVRRILRTGNKGTRNIEGRRITGTGDIEQGTGHIEQRTGHIEVRRILEKGNSEQGTGNKEVRRSIPLSGKIIRISAYQMRISVLPIGFNRNILQFWKNNFTRNSG